MVQLSILDVVILTLSTYFLFRKVLPRILIFILYKFFELGLNVKSVSLLKLNAQDVNIKWKNFEMVLHKIEIKSRFFDSEFSKALCVLCTDLTINQINQTKSSENLLSNDNESSQNEVQRWEFLQNLGFYFNPLAMRAFESVEVQIKNFSFTSYNADMTVKHNVSHKLLKLLFDGYEKRYQKVSSKKELVLIVKNKDKKWKHFTETFLLPEFNFFVDKYKNFNVRDDDIIISGFPRSGTTRAQEMVWLIVNDFNFEAALVHESDTRCPYFDHPGWSFLFRKNTMASSLEEMPSPRILKTHLPVQFLPDQVWTKKPKIIYISRDVKDVAVSNYHFWYSMDANRKMDMNEYFDFFMNDIILYGPYRETLQNYFNMASYGNIMYLTYEEMSKDLDGTITNVAKFLGKTVSPENRRKLKEHLSFNNMKKNAATNNKSVLANIQEFANGVGDTDNFIRKGIIGDHKNVMSQEYITKFDKWYSEMDKLNQGFSYKEVSKKRGKMLRNWIEKSRINLKF